MGGPQGNVDQSLSWSVDCRANTCLRCTGCSRGLSARQAGAQGDLAVVPAGGQDRRARLQTARASRRCYGSWPASTPTFAADAALRARAQASGCSEQEPQLDESKDVREQNVLDGVAQLKVAHRPLQRAGGPTTATIRADEVFSRACRRQIDAADAWNLDTMLEQAMDALRLPPGDARRHAAVGWRAPPAFAPLQAAALAARPAGLPRRADQPPRRRVGRVARAPSRRVRRHRRRRSRTTATSSTTVAGWILELDRGRGIPYEGNYSGWLEQKQARPCAVRTSRRSRAPAHDRGRARVGPHQSEGGGARRRKARLANYEGAARARGRGQARPRSRSTFRPGHGWGDPRRRERRTLPQGLMGDRLLIESLSFSAAARAAIVGRDRNPTGAGQDDACSG